MKAEDLKGMDGRRVLVEGVIDDRALGIGKEAFAYVQFDPGDERATAELTRCMVPFHAIRKILPEPIKVGDRVKKLMVVGARHEATVLAIHKGRAWVEHDDGPRDDWPLSDLTLVGRG